MMGLLLTLRFREKSLYGRLQPSIAVFNRCFIPKIIESMLEIFVARES